LLRAGLEAEVAWDVVLSWIDRSPLRIWLAGLGVLHLTATPVDRQAGIASLGAMRNLAEKRPLPATVQMKKSRQPFSVFGKGIECRHPSRDTLEGADVVGHVAKDDAAFLPFTDHLGIKRLLPRIVVGPEGLPRLRNFGGSGPSGSESG